MGKARTHVLLMSGVIHFAICRVRDHQRVERRECLDESAEQLAGAIETRQQDQFHENFPLRVHSHHGAGIMRRHVPAWAARLDPFEVGWR
jgi:hypothetical protein